MQRLLDKAEVLVETLPYIRRFYHKTIVVKYGGHAMREPQLREGFALDIILLNLVGLNPIVVHGGSPQIGEFLERLGKKSTFFQGHRVTDAETMEVVEMTLGRINKEIVGLINYHGGKAVGLSGKDGNLILAKRLNHDLGMVGEVEVVDPLVIEVLGRENFIPVITTIGVGRKGESYTINSELVAGKLASALKAEKLILLTDVPGIKDREGNLIATLDIKEAKKLIAEGIIKEGMIPKVTCCIDALEGEVAKAHIIDGRIKHAVLLEIFTDKGIGSQIVRVGNEGSGTD